MNKPQLSKKGLMKLNVESNSFITDFDQLKVCFISD